MHPNINQLYEVYETKNNLYGVFETNTGADVLSVITQATQITESDVSKLIRQIISTLMYAHEHDIMHGSLNFN